MAVTGFADPARLVRKTGAQPEDVLFLTKPLGTGILTAAVDRGLAAAKTKQEVYKIMAHLNKGAAEAMKALTVLKKLITPYVLPWHCKKNKIAK